MCSFMFPETPGEKLILVDSVNTLHLVRELSSISAFFKARVKENLKYRNNIREFSNYENCHVKNNAKSCCFDGAI